MKTSYINDKYRNKNNQNVSVKDDKTVVNTITAALNCPVCPIFLAITKQLTVLADPNITNIATISLSRNPK
jgi:hypothetical protein